MCEQFIQLFNLFFFLNRCDSLNGKLGLYSDVLKQKVSIKSLTNKQNQSRSLLKMLESQIPQRQTIKNIRRFMLKNLKFYAGIELHSLPRQIYSPDCMLEASGVPKAIFETSMSRHSQTKAIALKIFMNKTVVLQLRIANTTFTITQLRSQTV